MSEVGRLVSVVMKHARDAFVDEQTITAQWKALNFAAAKSDQLTLRQKDSWRSQGIGDFLQGKYRPGLGGHEKTGG